MCNIEVPGRAERAAFFEDLILNQVAKPPVKKTGEEDIRSTSKTFLSKLLALWDLLWWSFSVSNFVICLYLSTVNWLIFPG